MVWTFNKYPINNTKNRISIDIKTEDIVKIIVGIGRIITTAKKLNKHNYVNQDGI